MSAKIRIVPLAATVAILAYAGAGCAALRSDARPLPITTPTGQIQAAVSPAPEWWSKASDPYLVTLVKEGLDSSKEIGCRLSGLRQLDFQAARENKRIVPKLGRLLGADQTSLNAARVQARENRAQRIATRRTRLVRDIAFAYVEVRRLQQEVALRNGMRDQYRDNAEVARFRREAGLVSAIDGALARSQDEAAQAELDFAQGRLNDAMSGLANLVGLRPETLAARIGTAVPITPPPIEALPTSSPEDPRHAVIVEDVLREARLTQALEAARRTVRDARGAYRQGAGDFSTLYVAEAAVTSVSLALINARASRVKASFELLSAQDDSWAYQGLDPAAIGAMAPDDAITVTADCD